MKKYTYLIICYLNILLIVFILGLMQGAWFDGENLLKQNDVEIYTIPQWQFYIYYGILCLLLLWSIISIVKYYRLSLSHIRYFHIILLGVLYLFLFVLFDDVDFPKEYQSWNITLLQKELIIVS